MQMVPEEFPVSIVSYTDHKTQKHRTVDVQEARSKQKHRELIRQTMRYIVDDDFMISHYCALQNDTLLVS